jgi:sigma-E factor negative regulatory protein RseB
LSFSDGVASLSVFIEALPEAGDVLEGISQMGATNAFSRVVDKMLITVVGEVPVRTVKHVGLSIVRTQ